MKIKYLEIQCFRYFFVAEKEIVMIYGYARVSTKEQNLDRQLIELRKYVTESNILIDKASGKDLQRDGYLALKGALGLREGDTLYIKSLDRLSRNKADIKNELQWFKDNHVRLIVLDLPTTMIHIENGQEWILEMINSILVEVLSSIAEQERITIRQRQMEGIAAARQKGKHLGRPRLEYPQNWKEYYDKWVLGEITAVLATKEMEISRSSFYRLVKKYRES